MEYGRSVSEQSSPVGRIAVTISAEQTFTITIIASQFNGQTQLIYSKFDRY
jgi:hypothetical protein